MSQQPARCCRPHRRPPYSPASALPPARARPGVRALEPENRTPPAARGPVAAVRLAWATSGVQCQCARTREDTQVSISDCSQATARVDSLIGTGNWFCEMSL